MRLKRPFHAENFGCHHTHAGGTVRCLSCSFYYWEGGGGEGYICLLCNAETDADIADPRKSMAEKKRDVW